MTGGPCVAKVKGWLDKPLAVTTAVVFADGWTLVGTVIAIAVAVQLVIGAVAPLMVTVPEPWVAPKLEPLMVIAPPAVELTGIQTGVTPVMTGPGTMLR